MGTRFSGDGNIGSAPEFIELANGNEAPRRLLRLNVHFDNPIPVGEGFEDRGGFWAPVEIWHEQAEHWSRLFQKGMRILAEGRLVRQEWTDTEGNKRFTYKVEARRVGIRHPPVANHYSRHRSLCPCCNTGHASASL